MIFFFYFLSMPFPCAPPSLSDIIQWLWPYLVNPEPVYAGHVWSKHLVHNIYAA